MKTKLYILALLLVVCLPAEATRVLKANRKGMVIQQAKGVQWQMGDLACAVRKKRKIACGKVIQATSKRAVVAFTQVPKTAVQKGDRVLAANGNAKTDQREPAATRGSSYGSAHDTREGRGDKFNITGGFNAGFTLFFPMLDIQFALSPSVALGLRPQFFRLTAATTSLTSFGGHLTFNYYSKKNYKGLWIQIGPGFYTVAVEGLGSESTTAFGGIATLGWRLRFKSGFNIGIGAGATFISPITSNIVVIEFDGFRPTLALDLGFTF
ncbi:MAG: hypothetical protein H6617_03470 [Bdellovibrionaceae bacterium]|nr:hypothetical protein [Pseudobdellovibrionaceae bacterium]